MKRAFDLSTFLKAAAAVAALAPALFKSLRWFESRSRSSPDPLGRFRRDGSGPLGSLRGTIIVGRGAGEWLHGSLAGLRGSLGQTMGRATSSGPGEDEAASPPEPARPAAIDEPPERANGPAADRSAETVDRVVDARLQAERFEPGETAMLTVAIRLPESRTRGTSQERISVDLNAGPIAIAVHVEGFRLISELHPPIALPADRDTPAYTYELEILAAEERWIHLILTQAGKLVGELALNGFPAPRDKADAAVHGPLRPQDADLLLTIRADGVVEADCANPPLYGRELGTIRHPTQALRELARERMKRLYSEGESAAEREEELRLIGAELTSCLPADLLELLRNSRIRKAVIRHQEAFEFPIELCYVEGGNESFFLADKVAVCRWYLGVTNPPFVTLKEIGKAAVLLGNDEAATAWEPMMEALFPKRATTVGSKRDVIEQVLETADFDLIHFVGHCRPDPAGVGALEMQDDTYLRLIDVGQLEVRKRFGKAKPFVMLNACATGQSYISLTDRDSFMHRFLTNQASAVIGTLWPVEGRVANDFARLLYRELLGGKSVAEAVLSTKAALLSRADRTDVDDEEDMARRVSVRAYCVFANPDMRVRMAS